MAVITTSLDVQKSEERGIVDRSQLLKCGRRNE